jgi:hypothetical protein
MRLRRDSPPRRRVHIMCKHTCPRSFLPQHAAHPSTQAHAWPEATQRPPLLAGGCEIRASESAAKHTRKRAEIRKNVFFFVRNLISFVRKIDILFEKDKGFFWILSYPRRSPWGGIETRKEKIGNQPNASVGWIGGHALLNENTPVSFLFPKPKTSFFFFSLPLFFFRARKTDSSCQPLENGRPQVGPMSATSSP